MVLQPALGDRSDEEPPIGHVYMVWRSMVLRGSVPFQSVMQATGERTSF